MELSIDYLQNRHKEWIDRIETAGIWTADKFKPVKFVVRKYSKTYDGLFHRKWVKDKGEARLVDLIILYQQYPDLTVKEIDNTLVHEMVHQYIIQNNIPDIGHHGKVFKDIIRKINDAFPDELNLTVTGTIERKGPGLREHTLIFIRSAAGKCLCCNVNPKKLRYFIDTIEVYESSGKVKDFWVCKSYDRYFDSLPACTTKLRGESISLSKLNELLKECKIFQKNQVALSL